MLLEAGARHVAATVLETRDQVVRLVCAGGPEVADDTRPVAAGAASGSRAGVR